MSEKNPGKRINGKAIGIGKITSIFLEVKNCELGMDIFSIPIPDTIIPDEVYEIHFDCGENFRDGNKKIYFSVDQYNILRVGFECSLDY